ncbi:MAG: hypothetical protein LKF98_02550 [Microbacteriaceae bacterium]|nr:hypothetical protein [Microbacteriaceae bacterium]
MATALLLGVLGGLFGGSIAPGPAYAANYPSWDEIQQAKNSVSATQQEISRVQGMLTQLNADAQSATQRAQQAQDALSASQAKLTYALGSYLALQQRVTEARQRAETARKQAGRIIALLARGGDSTLTPQMQLPTSGKDLEQALNRYSALSRLSDRNRQLVEAARAEEKTVHALASQARTARDALQEMTSSLAQQVNEANAAQTQAQDALNAQQEHSAELTAQLGTLQNQTQQLIDQRQAGIAAEIAQQKAAAAAAAARAAQQRQATAQSATQAQSGSSGNSGSSGGSSSGGSSSGLSPAAAQAVGMSLAAARGWSGAQWNALRTLWNGESGWRWNATNSSSRAYGIPQALPASKMSSVGSDWKTNVSTQITWGLNYIASAYGNPVNALAKWNSRSPHWY